MTKKTRSPNYPNITFREALEKARIIYKAAHQHAITNEAIAEALGYSSLNGRSMSVISAIKKYDLIIPEDEGFRISADAFNIFELPSDNEEYYKSLERMAFSPKIFQELQETYGETLPTDQILRYNLIKDGFNPKIADDLIASYRDTIALVTEEKNRYNQSMKSVAQQSEYISQMTQAALREKPVFAKPYNQIDIPEPDDSSQELKFRLSSDSDARIVFRGEVTQEAIKKLISLLDLSLDTFPSKTQINAQIEIPNTLPKLADSVEEN